MTHACAQTLWTLWIRNYACSFRTKRAASANIPPRFGGQIGNIGQEEAYETTIDDFRRRCRIGLQPGAQIQVDPNIESSGLDPSLFGAVAQVPPRRIFQRGARSFQWQAEDRNADTLEYAIYYRALNDQTFRLLRDKLRDNFYTIDGATLADGRYVIKVVASDAPDNPPGQRLSGERLSEPVDIDNTPPVVKVVGQPQISRDSVRVVFAVDDATDNEERV